MLMTDTLINYLQLFTTIPAQDASLIEQYTSTRTVKENTCLLKEGDVARELFFICDGLLKILSINSKGNDVTQYFLKKHQFCTLLNSFTNGTAAHESIVTACETNLVVFRKSDLVALFRQLPYLEKIINTVVQQTLMQKIAVKNMYWGEDASVRYQKFIMQQPDIALTASLTDIASYLGITPQSLSRIRRNMKQS